MTKEEAKVLLLTDPDYVFSKRFGYSLTQVRARYGVDTVPPRVAAALLLLTEEEVEEVYQTAIVKLRTALRVESEE
jgi:hypothetical protein